ncbi:MAG: hypothetical protein R3C28_06430 [Pirellulaceae bacterium]
MIIGDRKTGKTAVAIDAILNQKNSGAVGFYGGGPEGFFGGRRGEDTARISVMEYTTVIVSGAAASAPLQYIAPYAGTAMAEYFMYKGEHAWIVYDDLSKQAAAYRQAVVVDASTSRS